MSEPVRVLIADDEALVRAGLLALIQASPGVEAVGEAATGDEALRVAQQTDPDVVLMDVRMPVMNGTEATAHLAARGLRARVLIVTTFNDDEVVFTALRAGASGFVLKDTSPEHLIEAIRIVAGGVPPEPVGDPPSHQRVRHPPTRGALGTRPPGRADPA